MALILEDTFVKLDVPLGEEVIQLSSLDQQAQRNYAKLLLLFELDQKSRAADTIQHLKNGLAVALCELPDFASTVAPLPGSERKELELRLGPESGVAFRAVSHEAPESGQGVPASPLAGRSYGDLAAGNFPIMDIPRDVLFVPEEGPENAPSGGIPAARIQANFISGGLIIAFSWHHTVCDARGVTRFLGAWARHTKESRTQGAPQAPPAVPAEQTLERWRLDYGDESADAEQLQDYAANPALRSPLTPGCAHLLDRSDPVAATAVFSTWYFSPASLKSLRGLLAESDVENSSAFTQSEAVSALIWKHLSIARSVQRDAPADATSLFSTRIDYRARAKPAFHEDFVGNINEPNARVRVPLEEVCAPPTPGSLAALAHAIRDAVQGVGEDDIRAFIGVVNGLRAVTDLYWNYNTYPGPDLAVSDMSGSDILRQDWGGPLGYPTCIRTPSRERGVAFVLPQDRDGGFEMQLQSEAEAVGKLKADEFFTRFAEFRC
ncbi:hypothetical protein VUR80DRAFT_8301 [Thermomyces stellatus]